MERTKQKSRKEKSNKHVEKEKSSSFIADVKTFKENLKIREILRTVKMNSSMRVKAPRGSKVMQNKDFNENDDIFENTTSVEGQDEVEPPSATNTIMNSEVDDNVVPIENNVNNEVIANINIDDTALQSSGNDKTAIDTSVIHKSKSLSEGLDECAELDDPPDKLTVLPTPLDYTGARPRDRKMSLDHTMLTRRESLSQSEVDLHLIGKSPLERKSSFFKKKMDNFLKNTTDIFKRQSLSNKSIPSPSVQRRGSNCSRMSVSLQSLNENSAYCGQFDDNELIDREQQGSMSSLQSAATLARSNSSVSVGVEGPALSEESLAGSCQGLVDPDSPPPDTSTSTHGLNERYIEDSLLNMRAISMSSGLDTATVHRRRKTSRSNRVSWLASESLTDYFRRLIQDEKVQDMQESCPDSIPANKFGPRTDSKGRRLSYVRAVSGEDPSLPSKDTSLRRKKIPENDGHRMEIDTLLAAFALTGIPPPFGYTIWKICPEADHLLDILDSMEAVEELFSFSSGDSERQEVLRELISTESVHIRHLKVIVRVYIAAAHSLQNNGALSQINTSVLFLNMPDILNANIRFWEQVIYPMLSAALKNKTKLDLSLMMPGFSEFALIFEPYDEYMQNQLEAVTYLRKLVNKAEFITYLLWCNNQSDNRLQLADMLVKPMQRITKYTLIIERLKKLTTEEDKKQELDQAESTVKAHIQSLNRSCRQKEELDTLENLKIEPYEPDFKGDDEMEKAFKSFSVLNLFYPMIGCASDMMRTLIHQGDLRYKDFQKEFEAHVILFTDMMLICKKLAKTPKNAHHWKMQRPKILLHRLVPHAQTPKSSHEPLSLIYVVLDEHGTSKAVFQLSELSKEQNPNQTIKIWEAKIQEAMMSYALTKWHHANPVLDVAVIEKDYNDVNYKKEQPKICATEKKSRERVAAMLIPNKRIEHPNPGREFEIPQNPYERDKGPALLHTVCEPGVMNYNAWQSRAPNYHHRRKTDNDPYSFEAYVSRSGSSHEDPASLQRSGSSVEQYIPLSIFEEGYRSPSITVSVIGDDISTGDQSRQPSLPTLVLQEPSPNHSPEPRSASAGAGSENTLRVMTPSHPMIHSLPDISAEFYRATDTRPKPQTASEKLYRSHHDMMHRKRLAANQHLLCPNNRGASYPVPSPTRLKRGLAFSYSFRSTPPLARSKNIDASISQNFQQELQKLAEVPRRILGRKSPDVKPRTPSPTTSAQRAIEQPSTSAGKKKSLFQRRSKDSTVSPSPDVTQGDQSDDSDYKGDDDRSRRSSKSTKSGKVKQRIESCILELEDLDAITVEEQDQPEQGNDDKPLKKNKDKV